MAATQLAGKGLRTHRNGLLRNWRKNPKRSEESLRRAKSSECDLSDWAVIPEPPQVQISPGGGGCADGTSTHTGGNVGEVRPSQRCLFLIFQDGTRVASQLS